MNIISPLHTGTHTHTHTHAHQKGVVVKNNGSFISISVKEALWLIWWSRGSEVRDEGHTGMSWCCEGTPGQGEAGGGFTGAWGAVTLKSPLHQYSKAQYQRREGCSSLSYVLCWKEVRTDLLTFPTALLRVPFWRTFQKKEKKSYSLPYALSLSFQDSTLISRGK